MPRHLDAIFNFLGCCHSNERNVSPETALFGSAAPSMLRRVPVGPYTNIALAVRKDPRIVERVKKVVAMGGAYTRGNITPAAEFNVYGDPEAADVVFRANWDVTMVGLDLTHQALATPDLQDRVRAIGGPMAKFILDIWAFIDHAWVDQGHDGVQFREDGRHAPFRRHGERADRLPPQRGDEARPCEVLRFDCGCAGTVGQAEIVTIK